MPREHRRTRPDRPDRPDRSDRGGRRERPRHFEVERPSARREARRAELLDAAFAAIRRHGPRASMEQIAAAAGVTKPILYRHIGGRDELVQAITERFVGELMAALGSVLQPNAPARDMLESAVDAYLQLLDREPDVYRFLVRETVALGRGPETLASVQGEVGRQVAVVIGEQLRQAGGDSGAAEPWAHGLVGMIHAAGDWWLDRKTMPRERVVAYLTSLAWDGLASAAPPTTPETSP